MTLTSTLVGTCLSKLPARAGPDALAVARRVEAVLEYVHTPGATVPGLFDLIPKAR